MKHTARDFDLWPCVCFLKGAMTKNSQKLAEQIKALVNKADAARLTDQIQKLAKNCREMTVLCDFSQAQRVARLTTIPAVSWGILEDRWAQQIIDAVGSLKAQKGDLATLALACYGITRPGLSEAIEKLKAGTRTEQKPKKDAASAAESEDDGAEAVLDGLASEVAKLK